MDYRCARCKEPIKTDIGVVGIQCDNCGFKIFIKERPNMRKIIKAR